MSDNRINTDIQESKIVFNTELGENSKYETAIEILRELNKRFIKVEDKILRRNGKVDTIIRTGFRMDDNSEQIGLLSQCQSLQTLVSLAQDFGLPFDDAGLVDGQHGTIREMMDIVIEDVLERVCKLPDYAYDIAKSEERFKHATAYVFDASPYNTSCFSAEYSNVDSITWVITSFLLILRYHAGKGNRPEEYEVCKWEDTLIKVIRAGLAYLNHACLNKEKLAALKETNPNYKIKEDALQIGWNFTAGCLEPSLYFSYTVCECYLDIFETFQPFLEYVHALRNEKTKKLPVSAELKEKHNALRKTHMYAELLRLYRAINELDQNASLDDEKVAEQTIATTTLYGRLEANCKEVAERVWELTRDKLADNFFYNDLNNTVSEDEIRMSTTSDVLFNTVYIINIMLCAGLDESLELERHDLEMSNKHDLARRKQQEYDNLLESCLLAVQKAFRTYERLKNDGKDYIVDQFLIGFNENFRGHPLSENMAINELRKLRMRTFSLLPLLIHTNNKTGQYLVKYPHYNMSKYYQYILDNRLLEDVDGVKEVRWIWERDGFFCGSNYYYVLALQGYYTYYEEYEQPYIKIGEDNNVRQKQIEEAYREKMEQPGQEWGDLRSKSQADDKTIEEQRETIRELTEQVTNISRPVEDAVRTLMAEELPKIFADQLIQFLTSTSEAMAKTPISDKSTLVGRTREALHGLIIDALISRYCTNCQKPISEADYKKLRNRIGHDYSTILVEYVGDLYRTSNTDADSPLLQAVKGEHKSDNK